MSILSDIPYSLAVLPWMIGPGILVLYVALFYPRTTFIILCFPITVKASWCFLFCRTCSEAEMVKPLVERSYWCHHSPNERQLTGTWCTLEVQKALQMGYKMVQLHEV